LLPKYRLEDDISPVGKTLIDTVLVLSGLVYRPEAGLPKNSGRPITGRPRRTACAANYLVFPAL
jgi:hypothetical protein